MPRLVACNFCHILQRIPDVHPKTPLVPAMLEWRDGEHYIYRDEDGLPKMVPAFDPILEDFINKHEHGLDDNKVIGGLIEVFSVDQHTWDVMDVTTEVQKELQKVTNEHYALVDQYREDSAQVLQRPRQP